MTSCLHAHFQLSTNCFSNSFSGAVCIGAMAEFRQLLAEDEAAEIIQAEQDHAVRNPATELADVAVNHGVRQGCTINVRFIQPHERLPFLGINSEVSVPFRSPLERVVTEVEHFGCASGRLRALIAIRETNSTGTLTPCPFRPDHRELLQPPSVPGGIYTQWPEPQVQTRGFVSERKLALMTVHLQEVLRHLTLSYRTANHPQPWTAARQFLQEVLTEATPQDTMGNRHYDALNLPEPQEDPDLAEDPQDDTPAGST